jgi:hypothetical protein
MTFRKILTIGFLVVLAGCGSNSGQPSDGAPPRMTSSGGGHLEAASSAEAAVQALYISYLGRPADPAGLEYWKSIDPATAASAIQESIESKNYLVRTARALSRSTPIDYAERVAIAQGFTRQIVALGLADAYKGSRVTDAVRETLQNLPGGLAVEEGVARLIAVVRAFAASPVGKPQMVWFAPMDPATRTWANNRAGAADYMNLFEQTAPWANSARHVNVFKLYSNVFLQPELPNSLTDDQLRTLLADLKRRQIALAVEYGPLSEEEPGAACGIGVEGFGGAAALRLAQKIQALGGELAFLAMDEPFQHARDACQWSPADIARNAAASVRAVRTVFPNVQVGDIEVAPGSASMPDWVSAYGAWLDAWKAEMGEPLAFFHIDLNWGGDYLPAVALARPLAAARGIPFGIIYNGWYTDQDSTDWIRDGIHHFEEIELAGTVPDQVVFQSWDDRPRRVLPETDPSAMTYLLASYFRPRTALTALAEGQVVNGRLEGASGQGIAGATVTVRATPTSGPGVVGSYVLEGAVPAGVHRALVQICVNACGQAGPHEMMTYHVGYDDDGASWRSGAGMLGWSADPAGAGTVGLTLDAGGFGLHTAASAGQHNYANSPAFSVTPGSRFKLTIVARIPPATAGSGSFNLIFLNPAEVGRTTLAFAPVPLELGSGTTGPDGAFSIPATALPPGDFRVEARYAGSDANWPAAAGLSLR